MRNIPIYPDDHLGWEKTLLKLNPQFMWAVKNIRERKGTADEKKFYEIAKHLEKEIRKYLF